MSKAGDGLFRAIGLMSGTSMDGIDVAMIETNGKALVVRGASQTFNYPEDFRDRLRQALLDAAGITDRSARPGCLGEVESDLTDLHCEAVQAFLKSNDLSPADIDIIGFHGQTVLHRPETGMTVQIGDGARLVERTGIDVVFDLRAADCAAGGQGAPLAPIYHAALAARLSAEPAVFVNIGGVANITYVREAKAEAAFDCGPGNALIDDWLVRMTQLSCDMNGSLAAQGEVDEARVSSVLSDPFFARPGPKSLDRNAFSLGCVEGLSAADGAATLTAITAEAIARAGQMVPREPAVWVVAGGGRRNRTLMEMIAERVENAVIPAEAAGLDGDSVEAEAWAYLAVRSALGLAITFPGTTGVARPLTGGVMVKARQ